LQTAINRAWLLRELHGVRNRNATAAAIARELALDHVSFSKVRRSESAVAEQLEE
jgi:hypothetical protein